MTDLPANLAFESQTDGSWLVRPFQIVSLFDVLRFSAFDYIQMIRDLEHLTTLEGRTDLALPILHGTGKDKLTDPLTRFARSCGKMKLKITAQHAREIVHKVNSASPFILPDSGITGMKLAPKESQLDPDAFVSEIRQLRDNFRRELEQRQFMTLLPDERKYFKNRQPCGSDVQRAFPYANDEMILAGNCYATNNYTASVFHSMRAVELGARELIRDLRATKYLKGRPVELCDWKDLIDAMTNGIKELEVGKRKSVQRTNKHEFYNDAVARFRNFKDAWRNNVSHSRKEYGPGHARDIMSNVHQFFRHLVTIKKPRKAVDSKG